MKKALLLLFSIAFFVAAKTQNSYDEALQQGDNAVKIGDYKLAISKYFAAEAFDHTKKMIVKDRVNTLFDKIEALQQDAINAEMASDKASQRLRVALDEFKKQSDSLRLERDRTDSMYNQMQVMRKTMVGVNYEGGIVCFWNDSTGKHGLIAAPKDIDGVFTWQQAIDTCKKFSLNGYNDWRMPDEDELGYLYSNRNVIGNFQSAVYWSSSEMYQAKGACLSFNYGLVDNFAFKAAKFRVRPVRRF